MRTPLASYIFFCLATASSIAGETSASKPQQKTLTFFVSVTECPSCAYMVGSSINAVKGVSDVDVHQGTESQVFVTFDPKAVTVHQIAQSVADAIGLHGKPYEAALKLRIPDYMKQGNAARVDAVFAKNKQWIDVETVDRPTGEFIIRFRPLKLDAAKKGPQGWDLATLEAGLREIADRGTVLEFEFDQGG
ncbi:MAG: heavy-metal-associated domain-containing protein [Verrucomicrobiaceae bacterium]|nr:heavy-metal-associated domain-containing protein [Verrucomicrobiaceae bacterium]